MSGRVKAAVMEGDEDYITLIASSVYDSKKKQYLSIVCKDIKCLGWKRMFTMWTKVRQSK